jgi:hypothetical protein
MGSIDSGCGSRHGVYHLSVRNIDLDYDNDRKAEMINNADFQIKTDSDSCKEIEVSRCTCNQKSRIFLKIWCIKLVNKPNWICLNRKSTTRDIK